MTIDEAIAECKENDLCQIAEWLEELKMYKSLSPRELVSEKQRSDRAVEYSKGFSFGHKTGYNKAIDDFLEKIQWEYLNGCGIKQREIEFLVAVSNQVAEQLKAGGSNDD